LFQIIKGLHHLDEQIKEVLKLDEQVKDLAEHLYEKKSLLIMGRGYNYATCMEGALVSSCLLCDKDKGTVVKVQ
jgi:glucosamine--fructose-6-phosphate aminotransferase (isomerizing)